MERRCGWWIEEMGKGTNRDRDGGIADSEVVVGCGADGWGGGKLKEIERLTVCLGGSRLGGAGRREEVGLRRAVNCSHIEQ